MDRKQTFILIIFLTFMLIVKAKNQSEISETGFTDNRCNGEILRNVTLGSCKCTGNLSTKCYIQFNQDMAQILETLISLNYTYMEMMYFILNNSWRGDFPISKEYPLDVRLLERFGELRKLYIKSTAYQNHPVTMKFNRSTFAGCSGLQELHINIPLKDNNKLYQITEPLRQLKILDFKHLRGVSYKNIHKVMLNLTRNIEKLWLRHFQITGQEGYRNVLNTPKFLAGKFEKLYDINLSFNGFTLVLTGWYNATPNLKRLDISHNLITYNTNAPFLIEALMHPSIEVLNISNQGYYDSFAKRVFVYEPMPFLNTQNFGNPPFIPAHNLDTVESAWPNMSRYGPLIKCINGVTNGNVSALFSNDTSVFCGAIRNCTFSNWKTFSCDTLPSLTELYDPKCQLRVKIPLGRNLTEFYFADNFLDPMSHAGVVLTGNVCFTENKLQRVDFASNFFWAHNAKIPETISRMNQAIGLDHLQELNLENNRFRIDMTSSSIKFPYLTILRMANNYAQISDGVSLCRDKAIHQLAELDLSQNNLTDKLPSQLVENCANLTILRLAGNSLNSSVFLSLKGADRLTYIDLSNNSMETLSSKFLAELDSVEGRYIDISSNPIACGCTKESLAFIKWLASDTKKTTLMHEDKVLCVTKTGLRSLKSISYKELWTECMFVIPIAASVTVSMGTVFTVLFIAALYRHRFRIQHRLFTFQQWIKGVCWSENKDYPKPNPYLYDAFVSYSSEDRFWVHDVLMKTLEETYGFKLMIHYRDIPLGVSVQRAIDDRMSKSREYILVFSKNFFESDWCQTEMEEAYRESLRRHSHLAVIILGEVPTGITNPTANTILDQHNYLQWKLDGENEDSSHKRKLFWAKLVHHLYGNSSFSCCCCCAFGPRAVGYRDVQNFAGDEEREILVQEEASNDSSISGSHQSNIV